MDPFLGLLASSAVAAIVGTALKGIIRPVSWALLAGALLLFGSSRVVEATNSVAQSPSPSETSETFTTNSSDLAGVPAVALGWQSATSNLNPAFSSLYAQQPPVNPSPGSLNPGTNPRPVDPNAIDQQAPASPPAASPIPPAPPPAPSPRPIQALW
ncbi:hypothetical protein IFO70_00880 [Phormidium tenue FACHB-886]|nr:hypothetical protein [Phormidium tenue FACHB-886]